MTKLTEEEMGIDGANAFAPWRELAKATPATVRAAPREPYEEGRGRFDPERCEVKEAAAAGGGGGGGGGTRFSGFRCSAKRRKADDT